jgi:hypothetical protein
VAGNVVFCLKKKLGAGQGEKNFLTNSNPVRLGCTINLFNYLSPSFEGRTKNIVPVKGILLLILVIPGIVWIV